MLGNLIITRRHVLGGVGGLTCLTAVGCSVLPSRPYAERRQWPLAPVRASIMPADPRGKILLVRDMVAGPGVEARGLLTRAADGSVAAAHYEEWLVPPADAVGAALTAWLAGCGHFAAVVGPGSRLSADLVLESELTALYADVAAGEARATIGVSLLDAAIGRNVPVLQRVVSGRARMTGSDAPAQAAAMVAAVAAALAEIERAVVA